MTGGPHGFPADGLLLAEAGADSLADAEADSLADADGPSLSPPTGGLAEAGALSVVHGVLVAGPFFSANLRSP